ncbi:ATP-grasp fold amidoligase family protein [Flagellimonas sp. 2504JD4-2]
MLRKFVLGLLKKIKFLPAPFYMKIYYEYYTGKKLDLENPIEFNEKIQWLKVYYRPVILNQLVDKYAVRPYVENKIGSEHLNKLIAVYYKSKDVNFDELPDRFVIKAAHGYNFNLIANNKEDVNRLKAKYLFRKWLSRNQYYRGGLEWAYKDVRPKLIVEKYLEEIGSEGISDYKFYCFNGKPEFLQVDVDRGASHKKYYYNPKWEKLPFTRKGFELITDNLTKPKNFDKMLQICEKLAGPFPFVRVDLYNLEGKILFGEMTFYPGDGRQEFVPDKYNKIIGDLMVLPKKTRGQKYITTLS